MIGCESCCGGSPISSPTARLKSKSSRRLGLRERMGVCKTICMYTDGFEENNKAYMYISVTALLDIAYFVFDAERNAKNTRKRERSRSNAVHITLRRYCDQEICFYCMKSGEDIIHKISKSHPLAPSNPGINTIKLKQIQQCFVATNPKTVSSHTCVLETPSETRCSPFFLSNIERCSIIRTRSVCVGRKGTTLTKPKQASVRARV